MNVPSDDGPFIIFRSTSSGEEPDESGPTAGDRLGDDYSRRRELKERAAAKAATSTSARRIHQQLAHAYGEKAGRSGSG